MTIDLQKEGSSNKLDLCLLSGSTGVDELGAVVDKGLDEAFLVEVSDSNTREGTVDLHSLDENGLRDHLESGYLLHDAVVGGLVANDGVVGLVLDFTF